MTEAVFCGACGAQIKATARFCKECGFNQDPFREPVLKGPQPTDQQSPAEETAPDAVVGSPDDRPSPMSGEPSDTPPADSAKPHASGGESELARADSAPEQIIRRYLDENGGSVGVDVNALKQTWRIEEFDEAERRRVEEALASVNVVVIPPLSGPATHGDVTLRVRPPGDTATAESPPAPADPDPVAVGPLADHVNPSPAEDPSPLGAPSIPEEDAPVSEPPVEAPVEPTISTASPGDNSFCMSCGMQLPSTAAFCKRCGAPQGALPKEVTSAEEPVFRTRGDAPATGEATGGANSGGAASTSGGQVTQNTSGQSTAEATGQPRRSAIVAGPSRGRAAGATVLMIIGGGLLLLGVLGLVIAKNYEPSPTNLFQGLATDNQVLSPDAYNAVKAICWLLIIGGGISLAVGLGLLISQGQRITLQLGQEGSLGSTSGPTFSTPPMADHAGGSVREAPSTAWAAKPGAGQPVQAPRGSAVTGHQLATWGPRAGAVIIDTLILAPIQALLGFALAGSGAGGYVLVAFLSVGSALGYSALTMLRPEERNGQTLGKQVLGLRVVRADGDPLDFATVATREALMKNLTFGSLAIVTVYIVTLLNYLWPLWDGGNRALHDMVAGTRVVQF